MNRISHIIVCLSHGYMEYVRGIAKWDYDLRMMIQPSYYSRTVDYRDVVWC